MNEELTIQKLHWENIKQGYPYIEADDNNNDYVFGIEYGIGLGDTDQHWFLTEAERDGVVKGMVSKDNYIEIKEPFIVSPLVTSMVAKEFCPHHWGLNRGVEKEDE